MTRDDLLRLGQSGRPWQFIPLAAQALRIAPHDAGLRLLVASSFARLGLPTPAGEQIDALPDEAASDPAVLQLRDALGTLPDDRLDPAERIETAWRNVDALRARGVDLTDAFDAWRTVAEETIVFRASDGSLLRRHISRPVDDPDAWASLASDVALVDGIRLPHTRGARITDEGASRPYILEGVDPPRLLRRLANETPPGPDGYQPTICVVQVDAVECIDGLALADLTDVIEQRRVRFFVGEGASEALVADLKDRIDTQISGPVLQSPLLRRRLNPSPADALGQVVQTQAAETESLRARVDAIYAGRTPSWWADRYDRADEDPLRVLIPTSRYTTFVRHAAEDLAVALRRRGCDVRILMEPDSNSRLTAPAYLRLFEQWRPDMVVLINYTRAQFGGVCPDNIPFVCWVQDAMPHLFDEKVGRAQTDLDFLAGSLFPSLFEEFSFPRERSLVMPVVASAQKFSQSGSYERTCEICYVGHQSGSVEALIERSARALEGVPGAEAIAERIADELRRDTTRFLRRAPWSAARDVAEEALRQQLGREPDERMLTLVVNQIAVPLVDRVLRHETLEWAASIASRRGWRLHIHGDSWDRHPTLGEFARGRVRHGDDLRKVYGSSAANLHVSANAGVHQRILECALAGGLPLSRLHAGDFGAERSDAQARMLARGPIAIQSLRNRLSGVHAVDHLEAMMLTRLRQLFGFDADAFEWIGRNVLEDPDDKRTPDERRLLWVLADPTETMFTDEVGLERLLERAIERPEWRAHASAMIAGRVRDRLTHDAFAQRVLDLVADSLKAASTHAAPALNAAG